MNFKYIRLLIPPIFLIVYNKYIKGIPKRKFGWFGAFKSWEEAEKYSNGYDSNIILERVEHGQQKVLDGKAAFSRDSVVFKRMEYNWPVFSVLMKVANEKGGVLNVLDFGGSLGSSFYQYKYFVGNNVEYRWYVVEQPHFVKLGNDKFKTPELAFFESIDEALVNFTPDVVLFSSVLPYINSYERIIQNVLKYNIDNIIIDRTPIINDGNRISIEIVPGHIYDASYPCRFFNKEALISHFSDMYTLVAEFQSYCDPLHYKFEDNKSGTWKGYYLKLK